MRTFKQVAIGETFEFDHDPKWLDIAKGPWVKIATWYYCHIDDKQRGKPIRVGNPKTTVVQVCGGAL